MTDQKGGPAGRAAALRLFALSFLSLFLELMVIRWVPGSIRLVTYYTNLMLISSFLGIGLGVMLAQRGANLVRWFPSLLAADVLFLVVCRNVVLPGTGREVTSLGDLVPFLVLLGTFFLNATVFVPLGEQIGQQFHRLANLRAYAWDLSGSLVGTLVFGLFGVLHFSPQVGLVAAMVLFGVLYPRLVRQLRTLTLLAVTVVMSIISTEWRATWSAYSYLSMADGADTVWHWYDPAPTPPANLRTMHDPPSYTLTVNQNFYQYHRTNDLRRYTPGTPAYRFAASLGSGYDIPYAFQPAPHRVVIVGAGGGLDVEAALRHGAERVDAVEIDPTIVQMARRYSASGVYDNPKVTAVIDDARAFFGRAAIGYDLIAFGYLASHDLFSTMANIRLDGFVYTVEGFRAAWRLLNERGVLTLTVATTTRPWLHGKLYRMVTEATGREPRVYATPDGRVVMVAEKRPIPNPPASFGTFTTWRPTAADLAISTAHDDWPYLGLRYRAIPPGYRIVLLSMLVISIAAVARLKPRGTGTDDLHFGAMGVGFLLLETKSIVDSSLYFGATWLVSLFVIAGVLLMVLLANTIAGRLGRFTPWLYAPLIASILVVFAVPTEVILSLPFAGRLAWTILVIPIPIFFAGLVFSGTFKGTANPSAAFGANLVGAMLGGFAEYLSMATGRHSLVAVIIGAYVLSLLTTLGSHRRSMATAGTAQAA
jgi:uncharacterized protein with PQ loop repeat